MRTIPSEVILSWPTPNYTDPVTRGNALVVVNSILISLATVIVGLRLYTRLYINRWFGADDALIIAALIFDIGLTTCVLLANQRYGWDRHVYDIPVEQLVPTNKVAMASKILFTASATFTRLSLFGFYYRLARNSGRQTFLWLVHANVAYTICIMVSFLFLAIFLCNPVSAYWTYGAPADHCIDEGAATLAAAIINCLADFLCTILPMPMIAGLNMPKKQRMAVLVLFSLGFAVTGAGIVRTWFVYKSLIAEYDMTWYAYPLWIAAAVEVHLGIMCASAMVLRPLLSRIPYFISSAALRVSRRWPGSSSYSSKVAHSIPSALSSAGFKSTQDTQSKSTEASQRRPERTWLRIPSRSSQPQDYELNQWGDVQRAVRSGVSSNGSRDAILGSLSSEDGHETTSNSGRSPEPKPRVILSDLNSRVSQYAK